MKAKYIFGCLALLTATPAVAQDGKWVFDAYGSANALYGYSDVERRYEKFDDNNNTPSNANINLSAEYEFNKDYKAGVYVDLMAGADKELEDYNQGKWGEEAYAIIDSPYGRLMGGQTYNVAYQFGVGAPSVGPLGVNNSDIVDFITNPNWKRNNKEAAFRTLNSTDINTDGTAPKISYITPEFYNTLVGFTYIPDSYSRRGLINKYADYENDDGYVAAIYNNVKVVGVDVSTSLGYAEFLDNDKEYSAGISLARGNWTMGGAYRRTYVDGGEHAINVVTDINHTPELFDNYREGQAWNVGVSYAIGPYQVGLSYFNAKADNTDNEDKIVQLSNQYQFNKYIDLYLIAAHVDYTGADKSLDNNNKGYAFITGMGLNF